jgi:hypothetical protein
MIHAFDFDLLAFKRSITIRIIFLNFTVRRILQCGISVKIMLSNRLQAEIVEIDSIKSDAPEFRFHSRAQRDRLRRFVQQYGQVEPILVDGDNNVVDGTLLHDVLRGLGFQQVAIRRVGDLSKTELRSLRIARNRLTRGASWKRKALQHELLELQTFGADLTATMIDDIEMRAYLRVDTCVPVTLEQKPVSVSGDLWALDENRMLCGEMKDVSSILNGEKASVVIVGSIPSRCASVCSDIAGQLKDGAMLYVPVNVATLKAVLTTLDPAQFELLSVCVASREDRIEGAFYDNAHDLLLVSRYGMNCVKNVRRRRRGDLWARLSARSSEAPLHRSEDLPVAVVVDVIKDASRKGDLILDPLASCGATIIAAQEASRRCFAVEPEAERVDAALLRWQMRTGKSAIHAQTGATFEELMAVRHPKEASDG